MSAHNSSVTREPHRYLTLAARCMWTDTLFGMSRNMTAIITQNLVARNLHTPDIHNSPGVESASKNEYQDIPGGKGGRCVRVTTLPPSCAECLEIWSLNRPEPSRPRRSVTGILKNEYQDIPGGKGGRCVVVRTLPPSCAECIVIWSLNRPEPSGPHRPVIWVALPIADGYWWV